jgi:hypothetical protein
MIRYILEELHHGMRDALERTKMNALVVSELAVTNMFGG